MNGIYQGAVLHFLEGFQCGIIPAKLDERGVLFVGGSNRGWASRGNQPFHFDRVKWNGKTPFEIHTMSAQPDGFTLTFTEPVEPAAAANPASYSMEAWTYILQSGYGSPEVDKATPIVKSTSGLTLWHPEAFYTLNEIPR